MRAIVMDGFGSADVLRIRTVPRSVPTADEVIVRVAAVEVSRTRDVATRTGRRPFSSAETLPHVLGGSCAGTVVDVGLDADPTLLGRRVALSNHHPCRRCAACVDGRHEDCDSLQMLGIHRWGSYAEFTGVWAANVRPIPRRSRRRRTRGDVGDRAVGRDATRAGTGPPRRPVLVTGMTGTLAGTLTAFAGRAGVTVVGLSRHPHRTPRRTDVTVLDSTRVDLADGILVASGAPPRAVIDNVCTSAVFEGYFPTLAQGARIVISGCDRRSGHADPVGACA